MIDKKKTIKEQLEGCDPDQLHVDSYVTIGECMKFMNAVEELVEKNRSLSGNAKDPINESRVIYVRPETSSPKDVEQTDDPTSNTFVINAQITKIRYADFLLLTINGTEYALSIYQYVKGWCKLEHMDNVETEFDLNYYRNDDSKLNLAIVHKNSGRGRKIYDIDEHSSSTIILRID